MGSVAWTGMGATCPVRRRRRSWSAETGRLGHLVVWVVLGLLLVGLAGVAMVLLRSPQEQATVAAPPPVPTSAPTSTPPALVEPLTGRPLSDASLLERPAVAVKVSDVRSAHPQVGVDRADIVFCEPIGVSYTRLAAVFHSDIPDQVGPVRSARPMDGPILSPLTPVFAHTMAAEWVMAYLQSTADVESLGSLQVPRDAGAYRIDPSRPAPDHVLARPPVLLELAETAMPPEPYFSYAHPAAAASTAAGRPATTITVPYGPGWDVRWSYDPASGQYQRDQPWGPHVTVDGARVSATNVLVLQVESSMEKLSPGMGAPVPVLQLIHSSGPFVAFTSGQAVRGTWSKDDVVDRFVLTSDAGVPLLLAPGATWVELPAIDATVAFS